MTRYAHKIDRSQPQIVRELRQVPGVTVYLISQPSRLDLIVGARGVTVWVEIKNGPGDRLTEDEAEIFETFTGCVVRAECAEDVLKALGMIEEGAT